MNRIFDMDGPFIRFLNRVGDLLIINVLVIICCLPIVTIGAAFTGMHYVLLKMVRGEEGYLLKGFLKSFKMNFKQATILWLMMLLVIALYAVDFYILAYSDVEFSRAVTIIFIAIGVFMMMIAVYIFPVLSRFDNSIRNTVKNAFFMSIINLPKTIGMVLILAVPFPLIYFIPRIAIVVLMFGISLPAYLQAYLYSGVFKKFEPEAAEVTSDYEFSIETGEISEESNEQ